jgi:hypothetical protein
MQRPMPRTLSASAWIVLFSLLFFRIITYSLTDFSVSGDGVNYMKSASYIGSLHILPPLSIQPHAYPWLLSWFQVHKDSALALQRIGRVQQFLDLLTIVTLCWLAFNILGRSRQWLLVGAWILIILQPFTGIWSRIIYAEQVVSFFSFAGFLVLSISLFSRERKLMSQLGTAVSGLALGLASILRSDVFALNTVILFGLVIYLALLAGDWLRWKRIKIITLLLSYIAVPLLMSSYQYASSHEFGFFNNKRSNEGYFGWVRTWPATPKEYETFAFFSGRDLWTLENYPAKAFDSGAEKRTFSMIMEQWKMQHLAPSATIDDRFRALANQKIMKHPIRYYVINPLQRIYYFWINNDGSQFYTIPYRLQRPLSTFVVGLVTLSRFLIITLFLMGVSGLLLKVKRNQWTYQPESWFSLFSAISCLYVILRTLELGFLSSFMIAGLMELRFVSIAMPFLVVVALLGARKLTKRGTAT